MREGWEYKKLGQVCTSDLGKTLNKSKDRGELHPYLCSINILWDKIDLSTLKQAYFEADEQEKYTVRKGDLLVCEGGDTGRSAIWDRDETILYQNALHRLRFHESVSPKFVLFYLMYLKDIGEIDNKYSKGVTIKHLVKKALLSIPLPIPPKSTQLSIVSELDKLNELIRIKKEQLKDYDTLAQSIFYEMFGDPVENEKGWEMKTLGHICEITSSKRVFANEYVDTGVPFYRSKEVIEKSKQLPISVELYISESHYNKIKSSFGVPQIGDILVTAVGTIGKIWVVDTNEPFYFKDGNLVWLRNIKGAHCEYFRYSLFYLIDEYKKVNANGAAYNALTIAKLKLMLCPLPPLSLQQSFAHKIEQIERQKAAVQSTITDLETLLAVRMQYWFD
mgnify:CR=1 FL=1